MSMPFDSKRAVQFIDEYLKYLQFQSTLDSLQRKAFDCLHLHVKPSLTPLPDPPPGYITPSIDLLKGFSKIRNKAETSVYKSQYEFDNDIKTLIHRANEGHLELHLCSHQVFRFHRSPPLVSVSSDGVELPKIFTWDDAKLLHAGFNNNVSHLTEINGVDAIYFLQAHLGLMFEYHDPDARYNHLFPFPGNQFTGFFTGGGWQSYQGLWPGEAQYLLKFHNGSTLEVNTTATWPATNGPMNYTDGETIFKAACLPGHHPSLTTSPDPLPPPHHLNEELPPSKEAVYPSPIVHDTHDSIRGYYLPAPFNDTAVLQIPTFQHTGGVNFSQTALDFLTTASKRGGKTKLILDLSGNNGGDVIPGFNIFKILFPDLPIRTATRFRATELVRLVGRVWSEVYGGRGRDVGEGSAERGEERGERGETPVDPPFVASVAVGPDQKRGMFREWKDLLGPERVGGSNMSKLLAHFDLNLASTSEEPVYGYGPFASMANKPRPFAAENIVIVSTIPHPTPSPFHYLCPYLFPSLPSRPPTNTSLR